ncbi:MAG: hypothetical protein HY908_37655 [Myxococcales bacterium]|nr:hypothetical protein [Myxococcales bacterium]
MNACKLWLRASFFAVAALLDGTASAQQRTFTTNADFDLGILDNVRHAPVNDQLVLGRTAVSKTRLVWVSNTSPGGTAPTPLSPGWLVRIDTTLGPTLGRQTARFDSVLTSINGLPTGASTSGNNPGRVAVDTNGDVWIANRAYYEGAKQGSLSKFSGNLAHCIDRNNNGVIDTSHDANGDGIVDPYKTPALGTPAAEVEYYAQADECILTTIPVGAVGDIPRAVAVDREGKIWVANWQGHTVYRFNPNEPVALETSRVFTPAFGWPTTAWFYSAATADDYIYLTSNPGWSGVGNTGQIIRIHINNIAQADSVTCGGGVGTCGSVYGLVAIPGTHKAWAGGYSGTGVYKVDFDASPPTCTCVSVPSQVTAVTYDLNGKIWASGYSSNNVYRINPTTNVIEATCPTGGANPHGLSVDFDGFIWSVQDGPNHLVRFDPVQTAANCGRTAYPIDRGAVPMPPGQNAYNYGPYLYSDFTGVQIDRQAPYTYLGSWDSSGYDGGADDIPWSTVRWNLEPQGAVPALTSLTVNVRAANTLAALGQAAYAPAVNGAPLAGIAGRYVQVRTNLKGPGWVTSVLSDVTVVGPCDPIDQSCCISNTDCDDGNPCTADVCPTPGGQCQHAPVFDCCAQDPDCNDSDLCTTDTCNVAINACNHAPVPNCCNSSSNCDDGVFCTVDQCSGPGGTCTSTPISGCCQTDADCDDGNGCSVDVCPPNNLCQHTPTPGCCTVDADCRENPDDLCTQNGCEILSGTCTLVDLKPLGCCNVDPDCSDGDPCTTDSCTGPGGTCQHLDDPTCCTPNDPQVGQPCDVPQSPYDQAPCQPGQLVCVNGQFDCVGAVKPGLEVCDGADNDCNGIVDLPGNCPSPSDICLWGQCVAPCSPGEFPCPAGQQCYDGHCVPISCANTVCPSGQTCVNGLCEDQGTGGAGGSGTGGSAPTGGGGQSAGGSPPTGGTSHGGTGQGGTGNGHAPAGDWRLATGGGGCACVLAGDDRDSEAALVAALSALGLVLARRRRRGAGAEPSQPSRGDR